MKKYFLFYFLIVYFLFQNSSFAIEKLDNVGIAKYAVLETIADYTPLREKDNEDAIRITHLYKDTVLYADKQNENYYRIELDENKYVWVNKKFVEVQAIIPEKRLESIEKISFKENKNKNSVEINLSSYSPFQFIENNNQTLNFTLYDAFFDPFNVKNLPENSSITFSNTINNKFSFSYTNYKPLFGYDVDKTDDGYTINIKKSPNINKNKPLKHIIVTLDAGHGGVETGVCANGLAEKDINLQITKKLKRVFKSRGAKVYMTRKKDINVDLYDRVKFAKEKNSDILLSIHQNALPDWKDIDKKYGVGTYYYHNQSFPLAKKIQENLIKATNFRDDGINLRSFVLTRPTSQISVLIECGYLIKEDEAMKLKDKKFQKEIAKAIVKGSEEYLKENF